MPMDLGDAKLTLRVDDKAFNSKMTQIGQRTDALGKKFKTMGKIMVGVGIAIAGALAAAVISYAKAGDEVAKMAKRTGLAVEMLSELRHVAGLTGTDLSSVEKATKRMSKTIVDASEGMATYIRAFDRIGLSAEQLMKLSPEDQFWTIAKAIGNLEDATLRAATAQDIFGRAGTQLLPMMAESAESLDAMRQEAHDLGVVFDEEAAKKAEAFQDAMLKLKTSIKGVGFELADTLVPIITEFLENKLIPTIIRITEWIDANEGLAITLGKVAGVLVVGGALIVGLGMVAKAITAINAALVVMHGLAGPAGWAKLAAGIGISIAALDTIRQLTNMYGTPKLETPELPSMQYSGIVPGTIGKPVPIMAHGGEQFAGVGKSLGGNTFQFYIGSYMGDEASQRALVGKFKEIMGQDGRRTSFSGINRLEYFPGSSAP